MADQAWMLDTNALSELIRNPQGPITQRLAQVAPDSVCTSIVVACELRFGAQRKGSPALTERVEQILAALTVLPFDGPADQHYADIRAALERAGTPIGSHDLFIAAHARSLGLTLVTRNLREFERVPGLKVMDWLPTLP
jgi:tRNA(fMet)-specific endonuclease VapC